MAALPTNRTTANTPAEHVTDHNTLHADHNLLEGGSNGQVLTKVAGVAAWAAPSGSTVRGTLSGGYAAVTANQGSISTETDLTGLSVTVTVDSGERIRITGYAPVSSSGGAGNVPELRIKESTTILTRSRNHISLAGSFTTVTASVVLTPSAGSHTYKLSLVRDAGAGTLTMAAGSDFPAYILVEGIGT